MPGPEAPPPALDAFLTFAQALADAADALAMQHFRRDLITTTKPDRTPVTQADTEIEEALRERITQTYPAHGILGEEFGTKEGEGEYRWIIDPIDATAAFLRGVPNFATLLGLEHGGRVVLGLASAPAMGLRWWGGPDLGAFENGRRIHVSRVQKLSDANVCHGEIRAYDKYGLGDGWRKLWSRTWRQSGFGDFYGHMVVANGGADLMPEPVVAPWDLAAVKAIVEGAGGRFTDLTGQDTIYAGHGLTSNGILHDEALRLLDGPPQRVKAHPA